MQSAVKFDAEPRSPDAVEVSRPARPRSALVRLAAVGRFRLRAAWALWVVAVFVWPNLGVDHQTLVDVSRAEKRGTLPDTTWSDIQAARRYLTDDGDVRRYFAYANAALGRPYHAFYVRPLEAWVQSFRYFGVDQDADRANPAVGGDHALAPYRDYLVEYPPGFFLVALPVALLTRDADTYRLLFGLLMGGLLTAALLLARRLARHLPGPAIDEAAVIAWGAVACCALGAVTTHRYDALIALCVVAMCVCTFERRPVLLGLATGLGIGAKLVPVVAAPLFVLYLAREKRHRELAIAAGVALAVTAAIFMPAVALAGPRLMDTFRYHGARPLQIETTAAALLGLVRLIDTDALDVVRSYGSTNVDGPLAVRALALLGPLTAASLVALYAHTMLRLLREPGRLARNDILARATFAAFAVFMVFGKVFSPQYLSWLLPLGTVLSIKRGRAGAALFVALLATTQLIFPATYSFLEELNPLSCALVLARNGLLLYLAARLVTTPQPIVRGAPIAADFVTRVASTSPMPSPVTPEGA